MNAEAFVPIENLANHFCVGVHTIRSWVRQGYIPRSAYIRAGNTYRFSVERVVNALTSGNMEFPDSETAEVLATDVEERENIQAEPDEETLPVQLELDFGLDADKDI